MAVGRPEAVEKKIETLRENLPRRESMSLISNNGSVQQTIMQEAMQECPAQPGEKVDQWWLPEEGLLVIDLESGDE